MFITLIQLQRNPASKQCLLIRPSKDDVGW